MSDFIIQSLSSRGRAPEPAVGVAPGFTSDRLDGLFSVSGTFFTLLLYFGVVCFCGVGSRRLQLPDEAVMGSQIVYPSRA